MTDAFFVSLSNLREQIQLLLGSADRFPVAIKDTLAINFAGLQSAFEEVEHRAEELTSNRQLIDDFFENAAMPSHWVGPDGKILRINQAELDLLGYSREEFLGHHIADFHADSDSIEDILRRLSSGETIQDYPAQLRAKDGSIKHVLISSNVLWEDGRFIHTQCFTRDITIHKSAEEEMHRREQEFLALVENSPDIVTRFDRDLRHRYINPAIESATGIPASNFIGKTKEEVGLPVEFAAMWEHHVRTAFETGLEDEIEFQYPSPDGVRHYRARVMPEFSEDGEVASVLAISRDVTDQKQSEQQLQEALAFKEELLQVVAAGVYTCDASGVITSYNRRAVELWGREPQLGDTKERFCGAHELYYLDGAFLPHDQTPVAEVLRTGIPARNQEVFMQRPDGSRIITLANIAPIKGPDGEIKGVINCLLDITQRKEAEAALRQSQAFWEHLLSILPVGVYSTDKEGVITSFNQSAAELWGRSPALNVTSERFCGSFKMYDLQENLVPHSECPMGQTLQDGMPRRNLEIVIERPDGSRAVALVNPSPIWDKRGKLVGAVNCFMDITERKQVEEQINQRARQQEVVAQIGQLALKGATLEALFNEAVEKVADALDVEYCNVLKLLPNGDKLLLLAGIGWKEGYVGAATVGIEKDSQAGFTLLSDSRVIVDDLRTESRFNAPLLLREHGVTSGMSVVISLRSRPFGVLGAHTTRQRKFTRDDANFLQAVANILADSIERKLTEDRLAEERNRLERLVDTAPVGVTLVDSEGNIVLINQEMERIIGRQRKELIGRKWHEQGIVKLHPDGEPYELEETPTYRSLHYGKTVRAEEVQIQPADGSSRFTLINSTPVVSPDDQISGVITIIQDITPLEEVEKRRSEFLGMVSHELRNPLNNIKLSAFFGLDGRASHDPKETSELFSVVQEEANRMQEIIDNLLDINRIEFGLIPLSLECQPLEELLQAAREVFSRSGRPNPLVVDLPEDLPLVRADRARTVQVLENLLDNAYKYSPALSPIFITAEAQPHYVTVHVKDQGMGIPHDKLPLLFKKFARLDCGTGEGKAGVGLGLSICKGIVEAHGGRIWASSEGEGQGTTFSFTLPVHHPGWVSSGPDDGQAGDLDSSREDPTILVVDDESHTVRIITRLLAQAGYRPVATTDPFQATHLVNAESPDLVLLDLRLPGMSGFDVFREIRKYSSAPIMLLTGSDSREDIQQATELKAADYITKPYSPPELLARIETALERQKSPG